MKKPNNKSDWAGYSFEQLKYQKIKTDTMIQAQKIRLAESVQTVRQENPLISMRNARVFFSAISYVDYAVLLMRMYRRVKPLFSKK